MRFLDDSVVTLTPDSRLAVADFDFEPATGRRHAGLRFFKGLVHTVVSRVIKVDEPDFLTETHTAVMRVRGTKYYTVLLPNATNAYLISGLLEARSIIIQFPEKVLLKDMEFTMVPLGQPAQQPRHISPEMHGMLKVMMNTGLSQQALWGPEPGLAAVPRFPMYWDSRAMYRGSRARASICSPISRPI